MTRADALALGAIVLWASLASLAVGLARVPPFLLTGMGLIIGGALALPLMRRYRWASLLRRPMLWVGIGGLFGYHFFIFMALRHAPAVEANLVNYLWPLGIVALAPVVLPGTRLAGRHLAAAILGFAGAALAILGAGSSPSESHWATSAWWGYGLAAAAALSWALYSLLTRRLGDSPTAAVGVYALISGALSLLCHVLLEPRIELELNEFAMIAVLGLGPLGGAFYLWDAALKRGDARRIGLLSFLTPILSTTLLLIVTGQSLQWHVALAAVLVIGAAYWGSRPLPGDEPT